MNPRYRPSVLVSADGAGGDRAIPLHCQLLHAGRHLHGSEHCLAGRHGLRRRPLLRSRLEAELVPVSAGPGVFSRHNDAALRRDQRHYRVRRVSGVRCGDRPSGRCRGGAGPGDLHQGDAGGAVGLLPGEQTLQGHRVHARRGRGAVRHCGGPLRLDPVFHVCPALPHPAAHLYAAALLHVACRAAGRRGAARTACRWP